MKKYCSILIVLFTIALLSVNVFPQKKIKLTLKKGASSFCGFSIENKFFYQNEAKSYIVSQAEVGDETGIYDVIEEIKKSIKINVSFDVFIAEDEDNAFATIGKDGRKIINADHMFLVRINEDSGTKWGAISILAHEIGHHIAGFNRRSTDLEGELDADYWSGYSLQKLGASKNASSKAIMRYGTEKDTKTHPNKYSRASTIEKGWEDAKKGTFDTDRCESCED
jgi:predicted Zn-dependent protease